MMAAAAAAAATLCHALSRRILLLLCYGHFLCSTSCKLQAGQDERKRRKQHVYIESAAGACNDRGREPL